MSQSGMVSIFQDFPYSPDMVSEIKVVSSSYDAQYGSTTGGQIVAVTKSGQEKFHGAALRVLPAATPEREPVGRHGEVAAREAQLRRQPRRPDEDPRPVVELGQDLLLRRRRGLPAGGRGEPEHAVHPLDEAAGGRLHRLARRERQPDPDLRPGHDPARRLEAALPGQHHPGEPDQPTSPRGTCSTCRRPTNDGALNNYLVPSAIPDSILGDSNYFFGRFDTLHRPEGPRLHLAVAPARRRQVLLGAAARAGDGDDVEPPELVGPPPQLGPHLRVEPAQPPDVRLPEPQRGLRLRQRRRRRQAAARSRASSRTSVPSHDELQRRLRTRSAAAAASRPTASRPARRTSSTTSSPGSRAATRSRSAASTATSAATPTRRRTSRARSTSAAVRPASRASSAAARSRASSSGRWTTPTWTCARRRTPTRGRRPGSSTSATPGTPPAS